MGIFHASLATGTRPARSACFFNALASPFPPGTRAPMWARRGSVLPALVRFTWRAGLAASSGRPPPPP